jgi:hypothetical protein
MNNNLHDFNDLISAGPPLEIRRPQWVQCDNSVHLAVLDKSGKWKSFSNDRELAGFVKVCAD